MYFPFLDLQLSVHVTNSFNDCKNLTLDFSLDFIHFPLPNGVNYVKFGDFVYLYFRKCSVI